MTKAECHGMMIVGCQQHGKQADRERRSSVRRKIR